MHRYILILLALTLVFSCKKNEGDRKRSSTNAFYYWQTTTNYGTFTDSAYKSFDVKRVYYRFFDVDWNEDLRAPVPVSPITFYSYDETAEAVPVVFITNETFKNLDLEKSRELAKQVHKRVMTKLTTQLFPSFIWGLYKEDWSSDVTPFRMKSRDFKEQQRYDSLVQAALKTIKEVQFDCDWTKTTKDKYFAFLNEARSLFTGMNVTSTVRLYQYKYPNDAGVPPVSRGMLMCYNAGDIKKQETTNSIFDRKEIMSYLKDVDQYPLPLDYALPIFSWGLVYRDGSLEHILSSMELESNYASYLRPGNQGRLIVTEDFVYGYTASSVYLRAGDEIRIEHPDMEDVVEIAEWLGEHKNNPDAIISLYHLNEYDLKTHSEEIKKIFDTF